LKIFLEGRFFCWAIVGWAGMADPFFPSYPPMTQPYPKNPQELFFQQQLDKENEARARAEEKERIEIAASALTIEEELLKKLPRSVRDWKTDNAQEWLADTYSGSELLEK
jgi:hypothetical protein